MLPMPRRFKMLTRNWKKKTKKNTMKFIELSSLKLEMIREIRLKSFRAFWSTHLKALYAGLYQHINDAGVKINQ
jgi:hypothetical protein